MVKKFNLDKVSENVYRGQLATFLAEENSVTQCFVSSEPPAATQQGYSVGAPLNADSGYNPYANVMFAMEQTVKARTSSRRTSRRASGLEELRRES